MTLALLLLLPASPQCEPSRTREAEVRREANAWAVRHARDCTLCAGGSLCREGFEREQSVKRQLEEWRKAHAPACAACGLPRCAAAEGAWTQSLASGQQKHREKCPRCEFDAARCPAWRLALEDLKTRHEDWKRDHPAFCDRCGPSCDEWRRRAQEAALRHEDASRRHRDRCADCQKGSAACDRASQVRLEGSRDRLILWRRHVETCACSRPDPKRR